MANNKKTELELDLIEIEAYRTLQSEDFDFGTGLIKNESIESEDAYYKMDQQNIEYFLGHYDYLNKDHLNNNYLSDRDNLDIKINKRSINLHNKKKYKRKLKRMADNYSGKYYYVILEKENIFGQPYLMINHSRYAPGYKKYVRKCSNKKVRQYKKGISKGCGFKKIYDYTYEIW